MLSASFVSVSLFGFGNRGISYFTKTTYVVRNLVISVNIKTVYTDTGCQLDLVKKEVFFKVRFSKKERFPMPEKSFYGMHTQIRTVRDSSTQFVCLPYWYIDKIAIGPVAEVVQISKANVNSFES